MEDKRPCRESSMGCDIPEDVLIDILLRMPAKSVARCRGLSKSYRDIIDNAIFTRKHYDLSLKTRPRVLIALHGPDKKLMDIDCVAKVDRLVDPVGIKAKAFYVGLLGSCRGIICLRVLVPAGNEYLLFWNPITKASREIYAKHEPYGDKSTNIRAMHVFGYDAVNDDLKILKILAYYHGYVYFIYSSRTDSWMRTEGFSEKVECWEDLNSLGRAEVFVEGSSCVHMAIYDESRNIQVVGFDFAAQEFKLVPLPPDCCNISALASVDGCLCLSDKRTDSCFDVWVMKEYGVEESWTRVFTIHSSAKLVPLQLFVADQLFMLSLEYYNHPGLYLYDTQQEQPLKLMSIAKPLTSHLMDMKHCLYTEAYKKP